MAYIFWLHVEKKPKPLHRIVFQPPHYFLENNVICPFFQNTSFLKSCPFEFDIIVNSFGNRNNLSRKERTNHETIYHHCCHCVLAYGFSTSSPPVLWMGNYYRRYDFTSMDKRPWFCYCIRTCIDAVARISELSTVSAFMLTTLFCIKIFLEP